MSIKITSENFEKEVLNANVPVLIDFWAAWCRPCQMLGPIIEEISKDLEGKVKVAKVNVDEENELSFQFGISSIPTVILFRNGQIEKQVVGLMRKPELLKSLGL